MIELEHQKGCLFHMGTGNLPTITEETQQQVRDTIQFSSIILFAKIVSLNIHIG